MDSADQVEGLSPHECFAVGMAIFSGSNSSSQLDRAIALIEAASAHGVADATEKCALFEAIGIARPPSWARALDQLQLAAEQGSAIAQRQLLILTQASPNLGHQPLADQADWKSVRDRINLEQLLGSGARQTLSDSPRIRIIRGFATPAPPTASAERGTERASS